MTKILLVEDDQSLREIYGVRLLAEGYDIVSAGDGEEALAMAIKEKPQLIVSDVMMPKISGFDMLDILRSTTETKDIKVIMMTALSSEDQRARGEALGADRYLVKSQVGIEDVVRTVHEVLGDAPTATPAPASAVPTPAPAPVAVPRPAPAAQPAPRPIAPAAPTPIPVTAAMPQAAIPTAPVAAPVQPAQPVQPVAAPTPQPTPAADDSSLPRPTAPFSTPRPANLGDRVINPITDPTPKPDFGSMIDNELSTPAQPSGAVDVHFDDDPVAVPTPPQPAVPPAAPSAPAAPTVPGTDQTPPAF